ncbi:zinc finger MYM-type protein 4-like [Neolamprologus brichardi]|uniref:zinc finger MYM-type protein 4-like n=1 Tax=Neolamprologus brichardi TaxID=32507 RepID=UPI0003EBBD4B|nr:zinc finger MYM-type protein 4-like [Neolamprologus brichardi]
MSKKVGTRQLCPMCQTSHQLSDMIENKNDEGRLEFFCSNRCMMVYEAQTFTVTEKKSSSSEVCEVKDVKPSVIHLNSIKTEPIDEGYSQSLTASVSHQDIKKEPNVVKEDLKIGSVFSLTDESKPAEPSLTNTDVPASCSTCKQALMDGATVYQRKNHTGAFCSTSCLLKFYQKIPVWRTCHFCLQVIREPQDILEAPLDNEGTKKDFCSQTCLSSFNYKKQVSTKIPVAPVSSHSQCSMCSRYCISKHEITKEDTIHKICSEPCFLRFCGMNNITVCANCCAHRKTPLTLKMEEGGNKLCSEECLAQFKQKIQTPQPCTMCRDTSPISDMVENKNSENVVELFCTKGCVSAFKIQAVNSSGASLNCDHCGKTAVPTCHLAMSDASIRNFCTLKCGMDFRESQNPAGVPDKSQRDFLHPPPKLLCAQCQSIILTTPKVIQRKEKIYFTCSVACFQEFKRVNSITATCEYCKNERIIKDVKRVGGKDCCFCSDACKTLFCQELKGKWGKHCRSCSYCQSISKSLVTTPGEDMDIEFCSEACCSKYKTLLSHVAKCDTCSNKGKLKQSLPLLGEVKYFCGMKCLLHFCSNKVQMLDGEVSSSPVSAAPAESSPVIGNVLSLANALTRQHSGPAASTQLGSITDIQTKVIGHASVQTVPKELKNKSIICTPLVHNKGVSCTEEALKIETQKEDRCDPKVVVLPVPVPVYVPVPMNMYSQYTPQPVGLPLLLPVPLVLPVNTDGSEATVKSTKESLHPENLQGELIIRPETEIEQSEEGQKHGQMIKEEERPKPSSLQGKRWIKWRESQTNLEPVSSHALTLKADLLRCSVAELSDCLLCFIREVKQSDGEPYSPRRLFYLCLSIQLFLVQNGRLENILSDLIYDRFSTELTKILKPSVTGGGCVLSCVEEQFLWDCKQLGAYSPTVLLNTLLFFFCKYFGFTTLEQHRRLSFANITLCTKTSKSNTKTTFLRFHPPTCTNQEESDTYDVPAKKVKKNESEEDFLEMMENQENPLRCPVRLYEFYLSKCPASLRQRSDLFYLQPDRSCLPSSPLWFSPAPLNDSSVEATIIRILAVQGLQGGEKEGTCMAP